MTNRITAFKNLAVILAWDPVRKTHVYIENGDLVIRGNQIIHVGGGYSGTLDETVAGESLMAMPGLINMHSHPTSEPGNRGLLEEMGSPKLGQSSLYEFMPVFRTDISVAPSSTRVALFEMLKSGVTTCVDLSFPRPNWADDVASTGIRGVLAPMFRSATWKTTNGHSVDYLWDEKAGEKGLEAALDVYRSANSHVSKRVTAMLAPAQLDTCTEELLRAASRAAKELGIPIQMHAAQSIVEFNEITRRHGLTPIEWLKKIGLLDENLIIGHGIFLNDHPSLYWPQANDFELLRDSGASVAHCPTVFARRGIALNYFNRYRDAGIKLGIGTDTFPHNLIEEMRTACYSARVAARNFKAISTTNVFNAVTVDAASMLGRSDIGRLEAGCKADFSLVDLKHPYMRPAREPLRSLIYSASERAVKDVYVDGQLVVSNGEVLTIDIESAMQAVEAAQRHTLSRVAQFDYAERTVDMMSPKVFPSA